MSSLFFITVHNDFGKGLRHLCALSAFYMGKLSPTGPCFKSPIVLCFLSVYDVQQVAAKQVVSTILV